MAATPVAPASRQVVEDHRESTSILSQASVLLSSRDTLEEARLAGLTDDEIASVAAALSPVLEKEGKGPVTSAVSQSVVRCQRHAARGRPSEGKPTAERTPLPPEKVTWVKPEEYAAYRTRQFEHH